MTEQFNKEQRRNIALRRLIVTGNCLSFWVGRIPENAAEHTEVEDLFNAWEKAIQDVRKTNRS